MRLTIPRYRMRHKNRGAMLLHLHLIRKRDMKILVIGGTGFISGHLTLELLARGHTVTLLTRGKSRNPFIDEGKIEYIFGDRCTEHGVRTAVGTSTFDAVYDMIAYRPEESIISAKVFRGKVGRFIHCSTISVYMVSDQIRCPITEEQDSLPLMEWFDRNPFGMQYGIDKRECESVLWDAHHPEHLPVSMIRPPYVLGPNDLLHRDWFWMQRILDGGPLLVPGSGDHALQAVYVKDLARAFASLLDSDISIGRAYTVAGDEIFSLNEYIERVGRLLGRNPELVHLDQEIFDAHPISTLPGKDVFPLNSRRTAVFDISKAKRDLRFVSTPFDDWMKVTIDWYTKIYRRDSPGYERRKTELRMIEAIRKNSCGQKRYLKQELLSIGT